MLVTTLTNGLATIVGPRDGEIVVDTQSGNIPSKPPGYLDGIGSLLKPLTEQLLPKARSQLNKPQKEMPFLNKRGRAICYTVLQSLVTL